MLDFFVEFWGTDYFRKHPKMGWFLSRFKQRELGFNQQFWCHGNCKTNQFMVIYYGDIDIEIHYRYIDYQYDMRWMCPRMWISAIQNIAVETAVVQLEKPTLFVQLSLCVIRGLIDTIIYIYICIHQTTVGGIGILRSKKKQDTRENWTIPSTQNMLQLQLLHGEELAKASQRRIAHVVLAQERYGSKYVSG